MEEREKHRKRKEVLSELTEYLNQGEELLEKSGNLLGEDDPVYHDVENAIAVARNMKNNIQSFVERGEMIEEF